ncbi:MAG TPA: aspartyl protease family protein [Candidatus Acidoferrales bacterium]|nr:aspartyl protease family protein [Candidatus Acidoferrales bacterium]
MLVLIAMVSLSPSVCAQAQQPVPAKSSEPPTFQDALHLYRSGKLEDALAEYNALIAAGSHPAPGHVGVSRTLLKLGRLEEARAAAAKALEFNPDFSDGHVALGEVYFRQGKLVEAEKEFVALVRAESDNARAYLGMARISEASSFHKQAKDLIENAMALDAGDPDIQIEAFLILGRKAPVKVQQEPNGSSSDSPPAATGQSELVKLESLFADSWVRDVPVCRVVPVLKPSQLSLHPVTVAPSVIGSYSLDVKIDGVSASLILDTGAPGILVNRKLAEKANLKKIGQSELSGIGDKGPVEAYHAVADSIRIGDLEFQNCLVEVSDKSSIVGEDGLIGADVFENFLVDLDFPFSKLRLSALPPYPDEQAGHSAQHAASQPVSEFHNRYIAPEMKSFTPMYQFQRHILVLTSVNNSVPKLFMLDTGAMQNFISPAAAREVTRVSRDSDVQIKGLSGKVKDVFSGDSVKLTFGNLNQENLDISAFDTSGISEAMGTEVSGFLGMAVLKMLDVKIDYRDGLVKFTFDYDRFRTP